MDLLRVFLAKCRAVFRRNVVADEIRDEMQFHVEMRAEELARRGVAPAAAARAASKRFGNRAMMQDRGYDVRGASFFESVVQDLQFSARLFTRERSFSFVAVSTLALAIGASTALFSVIDAALIRPLPFRDLDRIVELHVVQRDLTGRSPGGLAPSFNDLETWRPSSKVFTYLSRARARPPAIVDAGQPERLAIGEASPDFFATFGSAPFLGRDFSADDTRGGTARVAIISHDFWQSRFGGDRSSLGKTIRVERESLEIVGVLPRGFKPERDPAVWRPMLQPNAVMAPMRGVGITAHGKLRPGIDLAQASHDVTELARRIAAANGQSTDFDVEVRSEYSETISRSLGTFRILTGAVVLIIFIACINVAGLLLARGTTRLGELSIRASIGAGRPRLVRQLLTESLVLGAAGGIGGVALAWLLLDLVVAILPLDLPASVPPAINLQVLAFAMGGSVVTAIVFGLFPALRLSRVRVSSRLAHAGKRLGGALSRRGGQTLIAAEVALAIVLLTGAGLLVRSFGKALSIDTGFDPGSFITMEVFPLDPQPAAQREYFARLVETVRGVPGVSAAGAGQIVPLGNGGRYTRVEAGGVSISGSIKEMSPGYVEALGLAAIQGRLPTAAEGATAAVLSASAARRLFPSGGAVGGQITSWGRQLTVVGVVADIRSRYLLQVDERSDVYVPFDVRDGDTDRVPIVFVRPARATMNLTDELRRAAHAVGPSVIVERIRSGRDWYDDHIADPRHRTLLISLLGGLGLTLTLVGIVGVTGYAVARRTQEIGVRMAFGARPGQVVRTMIGDAAWPTVAGITVGLVGAYYTTRVIESFLYDTTPHDVPTFAIVSIFMAATALVAAWIPARRAARVDPVQALRAE